MASNKGGWLMRSALLACLVCLLPAFAQEEEAAQEHRWEASIQEFEAQDREAMPEPGQVLFTGSSTIVYWKLDRHFPELDALNRGFGGSVIADLNHFFERVVTPYRPRAMVVYSGDNDVSRGLDADEVLADFKTFREKVRTALPETSMYYLSIKPSVSRWEAWPIMREANARIAALAADDPLLYFVDTATPMFGEDGTPNADYLQSDGLHLNEAGYRIWTQVLQEVLDETLDQEE